MLDGQQVGDLIAGNDVLKTRESFGNGELYFSLSVRGWQPFVNWDACLGLR